MHSMNDFQMLVELSKPETIRRLQILRAENLSGTRFGGSTVVQRFGVSLATAKRDLREIRRLREKLAARDFQ